MFDMDTKTVSDWLQWLFMGVISVFMWLRKPGQEAASKAAKLERSLISLRGDLKIFEERMKHLPSAEEMSDVSRRLAGMEAQNEAQNERLAAIQAQVTRVADYLMNQK